MIGLRLGLGLQQNRPAAGLPAPPEGFAYLVNGAGAFLVNADEAFILAAIGA